MLSVPGEVVPLVQQLIRNKCVNDGTADSGGERRNAELLATYLHGAGLDVELRSPPGHPERASLIVRVEGQDPNAPSLCLCGHTDVVSVSPDGWREDPFGGDLIGGEVWGRGAVDMLNQTAAMAVAVRRLGQRGFRPRGTLVYLAVADEEAGSEHGVQWLLAEHLDSVRADYLLTEVGGTLAPGPSGPLLAATVSEKGGAVIDVRVHGAPAHGSTPWGADNALITAAEVVRRIAGLRPVTRVDDVWRRWVEAQPLDDATKAVLANPDRLWDALPTLPLDLARVAHASTHTTCVPTVVQGGDSRNVIPGRVDIQLDVRLVSGETAEDVMIALNQAFADLAPAVEVVLARGGEATVSPTDTPLWDAMGRVAARLVPGARLLATPLSAATDARWFRQLGVPSYGFGLLSSAITSEEYWSRFHGHNERIDLDSLALSVELWEQLLTDFLG
jgi:acetylornithine deacetylase/succinyl-diaminopimelate desuccinylase-like protein